MTDTPHVSPSIYVACLASYNNGILHGQWIDANQSAEAIQKAVNVLLAASPVDYTDEWAIHDYEGFHGVRLSEHEGFAQVAELAAFIEEYRQLGAAVLEHFCGGLEQARHALEESYYGEYRSLADYAQERAEDTVEIPESLRHYIDYEAMARDMEMNGAVFTLETAFDAIHIFWNR